MTHCLLKSCSSFTASGGRLVLMRMIIMFPDKNEGPGVSNFTVSPLLVKEEDKCMEKNLY